VSDPNDLTQITLNEMHYVAWETIERNFDSHFVAVAAGEEGIWRHISFGKGLQQAREKAGVCVRTDVKMHECFNRRFFGGDNG